MKVSTVEIAASVPVSRCLVILDGEVRAFLEVAMSFLGHSCQHEPVDRTWRWSISIPHRHVFHGDCEEASASAVLKPLQHHGSLS